jgi:hypothetical protein
MVVLWGRGWRSEASNERGRGDGDFGEWKDDK